MVFFFIAIIFMYIGRKIGWAISKGALYTTSTGTAIVACVIWGCAVALSIFGLIRWQEPNIILKIIMGYALGGYVAVPNFGLVNQATIPEQGMSRHRLISSVPFITYTITSAALGLLF